MVSPGESSERALQRQNTEVLQWFLLAAMVLPHFIQFQYERARVLGSNTESISMVFHVLCTLQLRHFQFHNSRIQK